MRFPLPAAVERIVKARKDLRDAYAYRTLNNKKNLEFTFDGKLVGDLGEAIAADHFDLDLDPGKHIDGYTRCEQRRPVQIKATGRSVKGTFQFRKSDYPNHEIVHLIAIVIYWDDCKYEIVFNGPEAKVRPEWREGEHRAKEVSVKQMLAEQAALPNNLKLKPVLQPTNKEID